MDCIAGMKEFPDQYFDLAIVDPPYGDAGAGGGTAGSHLADGSAATRTWDRFGGRFRRYAKAAPGGV